MGNINNAIKDSSDIDSLIAKSIIDFYQSMKILELDKDKAGKQATLICMAVNDIKYLLCLTQQKS